MKMTCKLSALSVVLGLALTGCAEPKTAKSSDTGEPDLAAAPSREERLELRRDTPKQGVLERAPQDTATVVTGEVPDAILNAILADLEKRTGAARDRFTLRRAEAVQWNDGSMGCAEPGQTYTQSIVPGYWVVIEHENMSYDYRASERGFFRLCPNARSVIDQIRDKKKGPLEGAPVQ